MLHRAEVSSTAMRYGGAVAAAIGCVALATLMPESHAIDLLTGTAIFTIFVISWSAYSGPALEANFGHSFFVGVVAYGAALLHTRAGLSGPACLMIAPLLGAITGVLVAVVTFRHRGLYFSMATMALQLTFYRCLFLYSPVFGGEEGIFGIQTISMTRVGAFLLAAAAAIGAYLVSRRYVDSRECLLLSAVGRNERLAEATGLSVLRSRALALALSGALAAVGGALYVFTIGQANAELAGERLSGRIVLVGTISGAQTPVGPAILGTISYLADQLFSDSFEYTALGMAMFLLVLVILLPRGLVKTRPSWSAPRASQRTAPRTRCRIGVDAVARSFGGVRALNAVTFELSPGTITGIIGPNGAGKTTLLRALAGEIEIDAGRILWDGHTLRGGVAARARRGIRKSFQTVESFGDFTIREHLAVAMTVHGTSLDAPGVREILSEAGLSQQLDVPMNRLPPAVARLIDLAMVVASRPKLALLDEPFAGFSASESVMVSNAIRRLKGSGATVVVVEHRLGELFPLADRVLVMHTGTIVADERPELVFTNPIVLAAYGTQVEAMRA